MENIDKILDRIKKLLAVAEGDANSNESATAAAMAAKLMEKYQVENKDVIISRLKDENEFDERYVGMGTKAVKLYASYIGAAMYHLFGVKVQIRRDYDEARLRLQGFKDDVLVAEQAYISLLNRIASETDVARRAGKIRPGIKASNDFKVGVALGICAKAKEISAARKAPSANSDSRELVVCKEAAIEDFFGAQKWKRGRSLAGSSALNAGYDLGKSMDLDQRGVSYSDPGVLRLS